MLDQVDACFLEDLQRAWADCPPIRRMIAAYLGYRASSKPSRNYHELLGLFPGGTIK